MDAKAKAAALGEVEVLSRLSHPNIVAYYGSWIEGEPTMEEVLATSFVQEALVFAIQSEEGQIKIADKDCRFEYFYDKITLLICLLIDYVCIFFTHFSMI